MKEDFKIFLAGKDISEEKYGGMTDKLKFKWSELFEKSKLQGKLSQSLIPFCSTISLSFLMVACCDFILMIFSYGYFFCFQFLISDPTFFGHVVQLLV